MVEKSSHAKTHRVKSYVIRAARMSDSQKEAYTRQSPQWVLPFYPEETDIELFFPDYQQRVVEIGFGMGDATRRFATDNPQTAVLGIEVHRPGVGKLLWWIEKMSLKNIRIVEHDAVEVLEAMALAADSKGAAVDGIHIWFPDPWPKKRHHKRRLIQEKFAMLLTRVLKTGAYIHVATDWEEYAEQIVSVLESTAGLRNRFDKWAPKQVYRPITKFETRGMDADRPIRDIIFEKE